MREKVFIYIVISEIDFKDQFSFKEEMVESSRIFFTQVSFKLKIIKKTLKLSV